MAYMNQQRKAERVPAIKAVFKKYGIKGSISVRDHMVLVATLQSGPIDFFDQTDHYQVNEYWIEKYFEGAARDCLLELRDALLGKDYFCHDDIMTDYFHRSHYIDINLGKWNKPYVCTAQAQAA
jgi:hypothetical protein